MEQARVLIAIVLSFLVFFVWNFFFVDKPTPEAPIPESVIQESDKGTMAQTEVPLNKTAQEKPMEPYIAETPGVSQNTLPRTIAVESPLYSVAINEKGAVFQSYVLKDYRETIDPDAPYKELIPPAASQDMLGLSMAGQSIPGLADAVFSAQETPIC